MAHPDDIPAPAFHPDPGIEALLHFTPVPRRTRRRDGWPPEVQRGFIAALAGCGSPGQAAHAVGRTMSGAYKVRTAGGGESFGEAWDKAVDLFLERNPRVPLIGRWRPSDGKAPPPAAPPAEAGSPFEGLDEEEREKLKAEIFERILHKYVRKLEQERKARLEGRVTEADFYVRQLTVIEIGLDLGRAAYDLFRGLKRRDFGLLYIAATPMSVMLDGLRRDYWAEKDEPERPPLSPLGEHDDDLSTGEPTYYTRERDGDHKEWSRRREEQRALRAEAQQAWEEKARADAEAWARREAGEARSARGAVEGRPANPGPAEGDRQP